MKTVAALHKNLFRLNVVASPPGDVPLLHIGRRSRRVLHK